MNGRNTVVFFVLCWSALYACSAAGVFWEIPLLIIAADEDSPPKRECPELRISKIYDTPSLIAGPGEGQDRQEWLDALKQYRRYVLNGGGAGMDEQTMPRAKGACLDLSLYDRADLRWLSHNFVCHFTFMYDRAFYEPQKGYQIDSFIDDGISAFGGYDSVMLWHAYPRIGVDDRNQFDFYRDMPGGLDGLRNVVDRFHARGIKVFLNYNPWDRGTREEGISDEESLARMILELDADGIFLDTMSASSGTLRAEVDARRKGVVFVPEALPAVQDIGALTGSWFQFWENPFTPGLLHHKWIEPRHMQYQINRWAGLHPGKRDHQDQIVNAFFNGSGMLLWENIFGSYNPWAVSDRRQWRRAARILHTFADHFAAGEWEPFYPTQDEGIYANRWTHEGSTLFTLVASKESGDTFRLTYDAGPDYYDLWHGERLHARPAEEGKVIVSGRIESLGCVAAVPKGWMDTHLAEITEAQRRDADAAREDARNHADSTIEAKAVECTTPWSGKEPPAGMVYVPGARFTMEIEHVRRECGCYPDPETPEDKQYTYLQGWDFQLPMKHRIPVSVSGFYIDAAEVSNAEYKMFLDVTGYEPRHKANFLKHWPNGKLPAELAEHPVVYVDLDDARAYAGWAGKRLPTEAEWHLAGQGTDGRTWPWGNTFDGGVCNTSGSGTMPVRSLPEGRSPYGCYHMAGNVYEWTESVRDDGHTRWCIIRGGGFYDPNRDPAKASIWYFDGGPRPCTHHAKFILMWPGLDRCATIGFRCVVDEKEK